MPSSHVSPQWRFVLADSRDLTHIGELKNAKGRKLDLVFNRPGSASFTLPMSDDLAEFIWPFTSAIMCYRKGSDGAWTLVWSGFVYTIEEQVDAATMTVSAVGWLQYLEKRVLRRIKDYTAINPATGVLWKDFEIIFDILADANATTITWDNNYVVPVVAGASPATPTLITTGVATGDFSTHSRQYVISQYAKMLDEIQRLTDLENGCDILVDPASRALNIWSQKMTDRPEVLFAYGFGPANLARFSRTVDPSPTINWMVATGDATLVPAYADTKLNPDPTQDPPLLGENSMKSYGLLEESVSISDAKSSAILGTYASAEVLLRSSPRITYAMTPFPYTTNLGPGRIPEPFVEFTLGDRIYLSARYKKRIDVQRQAMRVFGISVAPDDNGNEIINQLTISPS